MRQDMESLDSLRTVFPVSAAALPPGTTNAGMWQPRGLTHHRQTMFDMQQQPPPPSRSGSQSARLLTSAGGGAGYGLGGGGLGGSRGLRLPLPNTHAAAAQLPRASFSARGARGGGKAVGGNTTWTRGRSGPSAGVGGVGPASARALPGLLRGTGLGAQAYYGNAPARNNRPSSSRFKSPRHPTTGSGRQGGQLSSAALAVPRQQRAGQGTGAVDYNHWSGASLQSLVPPGVHLGTRPGSVRLVEGALESNGSPRFQLQGASPRQPAMMGGASLLPVR